MTTRRRVVAAAAVAPMIFGAVAAHADQPPVAGDPTPPSLEELLRSPAALDVALSPDGSQVAVLLESRSGEARTAYLILAPFGDYAQPRRVVLGDFYVEAVEWANDERLLIWLRFTKAANGKPTGIWYGDEFLEIPVRRVVAVGLDGRNEVALFNNQPKALKRDFNLGMVVDMLPSDPKSVLMQIWDYNRGVWALNRVDVYTGQATVIERGTPLTDAWFMQDGVPVLRYDSSSRRSVTIYARPPGETEWKKLRKFRRNELRKIEGFDVVAATREPGVLLVSHRADDEEVKAIRRFDLRTMEMGEVVMSHDNRDLSFAFTDDTVGLVVAGYYDDRLNYEFADSGLMPHFKGLNAYFADQGNVRLVDVDKTRQRFLLKVTAPRNAGAFYAYSRADKSVALLAEQRPWLAETRLARMETLRVKTRDGVTLTAYLSIPLASGPRPLVVMPHGGPEARDVYDFDLWAQVLAAQGWLVLQPNFRGSGGYGKTFADAGRKHWGDRMQEDVEDCIAAVFASGRADRNRVAILGASYGGYAALMGAVRRPELYKAVVSIAGDSDLLLALAYSRHTDGADSPAYGYWVRSMGDPKTDESMLKAASPIAHVDRFAAPVLLIHGTEDDVVTPESSRDMAKALKKAGKIVEHIELKGEGHNDWEDATTARVLRQSVTFIREAFKAVRS